MTPNFFIMKVQKDRQQRIQRVKMLRSLQDNEFVEIARIDLIPNMKQGLTVKTAYKEGNVYHEDAVVEYYTESNGYEYLRTQANQNAKDNLDNLPTY